MGGPRHLIHQEIQMHLSPLVLLLKWGELFLVEGASLELSEICFLLREDFSH